MKDTMADRISLTGPELAGLLEQGRWTTDDRSPLAALREEEPAPAPKLPPGAIDTVRTVMAPAFECAVEIAGPSGRARLSLFRERADGGLVLHTADRNGTHHFAVFPDEQVQQGIRDNLLLDSPLEAADPLFVGSPEGFLTLAGLVDLQREVALESLIDREPALPALFNAAEIAESFERGASHADLRWLSGAAAALGPQRATLDAGIAAAGLEELSGWNLAERSERGWVATPALDAILVDLHTPTALVAMLSQARMPEGWSGHNLLAIRTATALWLADHRGVGREDAEVRFGRGSTAELDLLLADLLTFPAGATPASPGKAKSRRGRSARHEAAPTQAAPAAAPPSRAAATTSCGQCGAEVTRGAKFCSECGAQMQPPAAGPSACPSCGGEVKAGARFCGHCGHRIGP